MKGKNKIMDVLKEFMEAYNAEMSIRDDEDYEVNHDQMKKLIKAYEFFKDNTDKIDDLKLIPKKEHAGVTAYAQVFFLYGDRLKEFANIAAEMSGLSIDSDENGNVCISFNIPNVFKHK